MQDVITLTLEGEMEKQQAHNAREGQSNSEENTARRKPVESQAQSPWKPNLHTP